MSDIDLEGFQEDLKRIAMDESVPEAERERARAAYNQIEDGHMEEVMRKLGLQPIKVEVPEIEIVDLGEFCVDCRRDVSEGTEWFASRLHEIRESADGTKYLKGFLCGDCQPFEGTLMEPIIDALKERRWQEKDIRQAFRKIGAESLFEVNVDPMLQSIELMLKYMGYEKH
jgi:hypothetical protein